MRRNQPGWQAVMTATPWLIDRLLSAARQGMEAVPSLMRTNKQL
jgi:hypothetical protein